MEASHLTSYQDVGYLLRRGKKLIFFILIIDNKYKILGYYKLKLKVEVFDKIPNDYTLYESSFLK